MSEYTTEEATLDVERDHYDALADSDHKFAPYIKHIMQRYWEDSIGGWDECKESLSLVMNEGISNGNKVNYLVNFHNFEEGQ
jgi:hypothetical protein